MGVSEEDQEPQRMRGLLGGGTVTRCSKSQNTTPEASLGHPPYERYAVAGNLESWSVATEKESFRQQSRKVRVLVRQF